MGGGREAHAGVADVYGHVMAPITARLEVRTLGEPIPSRVTARISVYYIDGLDKEETPVLIFRPGWRMDFRGSPMSRTWLDLGADAKPGDQTPTLSEEVTG